MRNFRIFSVIWTAVLLGSAASIAHAGYPSNWFRCTGDCPARIPDRNGAANGHVVVNFVVPTGVCTGATFAGYALNLDVLHSHVGDLRVSLTNPAAQTIEILSPLADGANPCAGDDIGAKFRDGADSAPATCADTIPAVAGVTQPGSPLSNFGTSSQAGTWQLTVDDESHGGDGEINSAALIIDCTYSDDIFHDGFDLR